MAMTKIKGLQMWCRKMTDGYPHVDIANFTTAWRNGMAFCALIHRFRPDLIDYDSLSPENVFENCKLAFEVAERELDIPAFLEAEDMARLKVPDKLSVITYVSQYYNFLNALPQLGGPGVKGAVSNKAVSGTKRPPDKDTLQPPSIKKATNKATKENAEPITDKSRQSSMGDKCAICQNKVYLLERHIEDGKLYHRSCFRRSELSPTNKVFTRSPFLSPSLSSEGPLSPTHNTAGTKSSVLAAQEKGSRGDASDRHDIIKSKLQNSSISTRTEGAGTKHPLVEPDRDDSKKSKMQPKTLFDDDKAKKASEIKNRLQNLKAAQEDKKKDADRALPFSSKEARKLEKRREEILASEKTAETKGTKRNVPLIFQEGKSTSGPTKSASSESTSISAKVSSATAGSLSGTSVAPKTASTTVTTTTTSKLSSSKLTPSDGAAKASASKSDSGPAFTRVKLKSVQDDQKPAEEKKSDNILKKKGILPDVQNLQQKFSGKVDTDSSEPKKLNQPVARPRSGINKFAGGDTDKDHSTIQTNTAEAPKAAPRKSILESSEKRVAPERPTQPPSTRKTPLLSDSSGDESSKSLHSPPPLPRSAPPPIPTSLPPPLPKTDPVGNLKSSLSDKHTKTSTAEKTIQEARAALHHPNKHTDESGLMSNKTESGLHKSDKIEKHLMKDGDTKTTTHGPVKSQIALNTTAVAHSTSTKPSDRRWSTPASNDKELAVFTSTSEKAAEEEVRTGLLASLAGVRGRAASVPSSSDLKLAPTTSSSAQSSIVPSSSTSKVTVGSASSVPANAGKLPLSSSVVSSHAKVHVNITTNKTAETISVSPAQPSSKTEKSNSISGLKISAASAKDKSNSAVVQSPGESTEALNVLNSLKHVDDLTSVGKDDRAKSSAKSKMEVQGHSRLPSGNESKLDTVGKRFENKTGGLSPTPSKRHSLMTDQPKPLSNLDKNMSKSSENLEMNRLALKRVMPEHHVTKQGSKAQAFDVKLKKVDAIKGDDKWTSAQQKESKSAADAARTEALKATNAGTDGQKKSESIKPDLLSVSSKEDKKVTTVETASRDIHSGTAMSAKTKDSEEIPQWKRDIEDRKKKLHEDIAKSETEEIPQWKKDIEDRKKKLHGDIAKSENEDMPQWKKNIEERKKKLREDIAKSESNTAHLRLQAKDAPKNKQKLEDVPVLSSQDQTTQRTKSPDLSREPKSPVESVHHSKTPGIKDTLSASSETAKKPSESPTTTHQESVAWQKEAEKRMAELAGFLSEEDEKSMEPPKPKRVLPPTPTETPSSLPKEVSVLHSSKGHVVTDNVKTGKELHAKADKDSKITGEERISDPKRNSRLKDSELEFRVNKSKLKPVEVNIDISTNKNDKVSNDAQPMNNRVAENGHPEDFREKLHHLKHVQNAETKTSDISKNGLNINSHAKNNTAETPKSHLTKPASLDANANKNNNSNFNIPAGTKQPQKKSDIQHIQGISNIGKPGLQTVCLASSSESSEDENEEVKSTHNRTVEQIEVKGSKQVSPKVKRKITVLGKNTKGALEFPPTTPVPMKRIQVPAKFDFEKSSDLELSLSDSTAKLTIRDKHTPPPRPPPPHPHHKVKSPQHISAIELQQQLLDIDSRLTDLELRGRDLEDSIRNVNTLEDDDDELMIEWFELVGEKNDLVRREADLIYASREQELEGEQEQIESQLRYLFNKPEECKSPEEKQEEDYLIQRKLDLVEQRNLIVDSMDEDRLRYDEEDRGIELILKQKGLTKDSNGEMKAQKGKKVAKSKFYT